MARDRPYSLARRTGLVFTIALLIVTGILGYVEFLRIWDRVLNDELDNLANIVYGFEASLSKVMRAVVAIEQDETLERQDRVLAINRLLQPIVDKHTSDSPTTGLGYYSRHLDAVVATAPWDEMGYSLGHALDAKHPAVALYLGGRLQRDVQTVLRGRTARYSRLIFHDGIARGHTWANVPMEVFYSNLGQAIVRITPLFLLAIGGGLLLVRFVAHAVTRSTDALAVAMDGLINNQSANEMIDRDALPMEFYPLIDRFAAMSERLAAARLELTRSTKLAVFGEIAATVAHDIRNPLAVISAIAQTGQATADDGDACHQRFGDIVEITEAMDDSLAKVLRGVRSTRDTEQSASVAMLVQSLCHLLDPFLGSKGVDLVLDFDRDGILPPVSMSQAALDQVLLNLIKNAMEAMPNGGTITVAVKVHPNSIDISVADTGMGIPEYLQPRVFERFFTTKEQGIGIGLASAQATVNEHGGHIWFQSTEGAGTTFFLRLPTIANRALTGPVA